MEAEMKFSDNGVETKKFRVTKRYIKWDTENNLWESDSESEYPWSMCEVIKDKEEFNSSEDYFDSADSVVRGKIDEGTTYLTYKCIVCGWQFNVDFEVCDQETRNTIWERMKDHVYLKHK